MMEPAMVRAKPIKMNCDDDDEDIERVGVARLHAKNNAEGDLVWEYVEVRKNRVFQSASSDIELAYQDYKESLEVEKERKAAKFEEKHLHDKKMMVAVMKCVIIAYLEKEEDDDMLKFDPGQIPSLLERNTFVLHEVMNTYFKTGISMGFLVNNPKQIYQECVEAHTTDIRQIVEGVKKLDKGENRMYKEALSFFQGEK